MATRPEAEGVIEATLPRGLFRVRTDGGDAVTASVSSMAKKVHVKFLPGDRVTVELSPFDPTRGRIKRLHK